jgi:hypothetical protein
VLKVYNNKKEKRGGRRIKRIIITTHKEDRIAKETQIDIDIYITSSPSSFPSIRRVWQVESLRPLPELMHLARLRLLFGASGVL